MLRLAGVIFAALILAAPAAGAGGLSETADRPDSPPGTRSRSVKDLGGDYLSTALITPEQALEKKGEDIAVDLILIVDTTLSMGPYLEWIRGTFQEIGDRINAAAGPALDGSLRLGLWGYRDPVEDMPGLEYTTFNYTPELLKAKDFPSALARVRAAGADSLDYPEDVFSGIDDALYKTAWRPNSIKIMVLIGDAPGHEMGHQWSLSGKNAETLRFELDEKGVIFFAVQIRPRGARRHQRVAESQFTTLARNKGDLKPAYIDVNGDDPDGFARALNLVVNPAVSLISLTAAVAQSERR